jgi:hypothetical protein
MNNNNLDKLNYGNQKDGKYLNNNKYGDNK